MFAFAEQTPVVVLAGGQGTRLRPYTTALPKPLVPVGNYPILEILLRQLSAYGFRHVTLAVGHLADLIQAYFKDGRRFGLHLEYAREAQPLGTAGPLAELGPFDRSVLVLNGDLLTTLDFRQVVRHHYVRQAAATIAVTRRNEAVDFGVVETGNGDQVVRFREKPLRSYLVSMGTYVFAPRVLDYLPGQTRVDFPELLDRLLEDGRKVVGYESRAYWMDIGRPADYDQANEDFPAMESAFLDPDAAGGNAENEYVEHTDLEDENIRVAV